MARPRKENAEYFSHDADMRNHIKIKAVRNTFGIEGYAVWCMLIELATDASHFVIDLSEGEFSYDLIAGDFGVSPDRFREMVGYFGRLKLIEIREDSLVIPGLLERMEPLMAERERKRLHAQRSARGRAGAQRGKGKGSGQDGEVLDVENPVLDGNETDKRQQSQSQRKVKESKDLTDCRQSSQGGHASQPLDDDDGEGGDLRRFIDGLTPEMRGAFQLAHPGINIDTALAEIKRKAPARVGNVRNYLTTCLLNAEREPKPPKRSNGANGANGAASRGAIGRYDSAVDKECFNDLARQVLVNLTASR